MNRIASMIILLLGIATVGAAPASAQEKTATLKVSGMTCSACPISVRHRALQMKGVHAAIVDYEAASATATATITYEDSEQSPQAIAEAISKLGYPATVGNVEP